MIKEPVIILYGPTGVGKTDFALELANKLPVEIINADLGQFYTPLSIGTAKPDWKKSSVPHHLFDIVDKPEDITVTHYRALLKPLIEDVISRNKIPIIVGGSGFYLHSFLFPPAGDKKPLQPRRSSQFGTWQELHCIDPVRAAQIHPHDAYRINRALEIWQSTGIKPSLQKPIYEPLWPFVFIFLNRDRNSLYERINERVSQMLEQGWIDETKKVRSGWQSFLKKKKLIGYDDILYYLEGSQTKEAYETLVTTIAKKTRNYAKRQITFWRMLEKKVKAFRKNQNSNIAMEFALDKADSSKYVNKLIGYLQKGE